MENNFENGKRNVARLMLKKKKLDSEKLLDLVMKTAFSLNRVRVVNPAPKPASPTTSTLERLASARAKEREDKKTEEEKRQKLAALKELRIAKSAKSDATSKTSTVTVKQSSSGVQSSSSDAKPSASTTSAPSASNRSTSSDVKPTTSAVKPVAPETRLSSASSGADVKTVKPQPASGASKSAPTPATSSSAASTSKSKSNDSGTKRCEHCNFRGIHAAVERHEFWHTPEARKRSRTLRHRCHLCFYASDVAAHVQVHLMCAHFMERPSWDGSGGKPGTLPGGKSRTDGKGWTSATLPAEQKRCLEQKRYDCPLCDCFFSDKVEFREHIEQFHTEGRKPKRPCPFPHCFSENSNSHSTWYHKMGPLRNRLCNHCGGTVYHGKDSQHGESACVRDRSLSFECPMPICGYGTKTLGEIDSHLVECHSLWVRGMSGSRTAPYFCPECPETVSYKEFVDHLAQHRKKREAEEVKEIEVVSPRQQQTAVEKRDRRHEESRRATGKEPQKKTALSSTEKPVIGEDTNRPAERRGTRAAERSTQRATNEPPPLTGRTARQSAEHEPRRPVGRPPKRLSVPPTLQPSVLSPQHPSIPSPLQSSAPPLLSPSVPTPPPRADAAVSGGDEQRRADGASAAEPALDDVVILSDDEWVDSDEDPDDVIPIDSDTPVEEVPAEVVREETPATVTTSHAAADVAPSSTAIVTPGEGSGEGKGKGISVEGKGKCTPGEGKVNGTPVEGKGKDTPGKGKESPATRICKPTAEDDQATRTRNSAPEAREAEKSHKTSPEDDVQVRRTRKSARGETHEVEEESHKPAVTPSPPPSQRWNRVSIGRFLVDKCQQPIQDTTFFSLDSGQDQSRGGAEHCFFCEFVAGSAEEVGMHLGEAHAQEAQSFETFLKSCVARNKRKRCPMCGIGFRSKWVFFRHIMSHTISVPLIPHILDRCDIIDAAEFGEPF